MKIVMVGVGVPDDPSGKFDLDGQIFPHSPCRCLGRWDVEDAVPYGKASLPEACRYAQTCPVFVFFGDIDEICIKKPD